MSKKPKAAKAAPAKTEKPVSVKIDPKPVSKKRAGKDAKPMPSGTIKGAIRENSKQAQLIDMLKRSGGATIPQIMDVTGWQQHSVRGFLSGTIKKKLGLKVISDKSKDIVRTYRIKAT